MARVPTYDGRTVAPDAAPRVQLSSAGATPDAFGAGVGDALTRSGNALSQHAMRMQDDDNATEARAADARFAAEIRSTMFGAPDGSSTGYYATKGKPAVDGYDATAKALAEKRKAVAASLNPGAQRMFDEIAQRRTESELDRMASHAATERRAYHASVFETTVKSAADDALAWYSNAPKFNQSMATLRGTIQEYAESEGWAPERTVEALQQAESGVRRGVAERMALTDPIGAASYVEANRERLSGADQMALERILTPAMHDQQANEDYMNADNQPVGPTRVTSARDAQALAAAVEQQESNGSNGVVSPKGALGIMQVMPATAQDMARKLGISYDPEKLRNDINYNRRIGQAYLNDMLDRYGGNTTLALAAYNAGPGNVDKWIKANGDPRQGAIGDGEWAARIPVDETRKYVPGVLRRLGGSAPTNAPREADEATIFARIDALAEAGGWDRGRIERAKAAATKNINIDRRLLADRERQLSDGAWAAFDAGQKLPPQIIAALPRTTREQIKAAEMRRATGADVETDPIRMAAIRDMAATDPDAFAKLDLNQFRGKLSRVEIGQVDDLQRDIVKNGAKSPKAVLHSRITSTTSDLLEAAGITLTGVSGDKRQRNAVLRNKFYDKVSADVAAYVAENNKQPDDDMIRRFADRWLMQVSVKDSGKFFRGDDVLPLVAVPAGARLNVENANVPANARAMIVSRMKARGLNNPTEADIVRAYVETGLR